MPVHMSQCRNVAEKKNIMFISVIVSNSGKISSGCSLKGSPKRIIFLYITMSLASCFVTPTKRMCFYINSLSYNILLLSSSNNVCMCMRLCLPTVFLPFQLSLSMHIRMNRNLNFW